MATERRVNLCAGIPGLQAHRTEGDLVAGLCESCEEKLISTKSWSSAAPNLHKSGKGPSIVINPEKHQALAPSPRMAKAPK